MFNTNRKRLAAGGITAGFMAVVSILSHRAFFSAPYGLLLFISAILLSALAGAAIAFGLNLSEKAEKRFAMGVLFSGPFFTMVMVECLGNNLVYHFTPVAFLCNYIFYLLLYGIVYTFTNRIRLSAIVTNAVLFVFGLVNHLVLNFRGSPFLPLDFLGANTALNVVQNYDFTPTMQMIIASWMLVILIAVSAKVTYVNRTLRKTLIRRGYTMTAVFIISYAFYGTTTLEDLNIKANLWDQQKGYLQQGSVVSFWLNTKYLFVSEPKSYSVDKVEEIANSQSDSLQTKDIEADTPETVKPNIIAVMNETWSDMSVVGDFETNRDYMPFVRDLKENTIKGNLYVSIYGNGTSNSEFEFLTGNTLAFLPTGSNAYEQYILSETQSLVSILAEQGYARQAVHPYYRDGWSRDTVYPLLGIEEFYDIEAFDQNRLMRRYISDRDNYKKVISLFEERDKEKPWFCLNVTMQNHGGYGTVYPNFPQTVTVSDDPLLEYPKTQQYLSLMRETDNAFKELITYFSKVEEPTIIVMFGDHQAGIEQEFYEKLKGKPLSEWTLEENMTRYITPFVIWANYDIPEDEIEMMSANYLSSYLLSVSGLELTTYNQYLLSLYEQLPVVNAIGYADSDGNFYDYSEDTPYTDLLESYKILQYNNMFDKNGKVNSVFSLNTEDTPFGSEPAAPQYAEETTSHFGTSLLPRRLFSAYS